MLLYLAALELTAEILICLLKLLFTARKFLDLPVNFFESHGC